MEPLEEAVLHTLRLVAGHGIQSHCVDAAEDAVLDVGVVALEAAQQGLDSCRLEPPPPLSHMVQFSVKRQAHWMNSSSL